MCSRSCFMYSLKLEYLLRDIEVDFWFPSMCVCVSTVRIANCLRVYKLRAPICLACDFIASTRPSDTRNIIIFAAARVCVWVRLRMRVFNLVVRCLACDIHTRAKKKIRLESMVETLWRNQHHHISSSSSLGSDHRYPNRITNRFCHRMLHNLYGVARFVVHRSTGDTHTHARARSSPIRSIHVVVHFVWILHSLAFTALIGIIQINILFLSLHKFLFFLCVCLRCGSTDAQEPHRCRTPYIDRNPKWILCL